MSTPSTEERAPTLHEVADLAGVSLKTASRALNGEQYVADATREKVLDAAAQLGFRFNASASKLKRGVRSSTIALVTGDLANPFYSVLAKGVEREVRARGLELTIASSEESPDAERSLVEELVLSRVRGLILVSTLESHEHMATVQASGIPVAFVDRGPVGVAADSVVLDNTGGARAATEQLLALGHRRIGYVSHFARLQPQRERETAFIDVMQRAGIDTWRDHVVEGVSDIPGSRAAVAELLERDEPPTAIITGNNRITLGALAAIAEHAPETALIGFDDFDAAELLGVTTVSFDPEQMGHAAAQQVLDATEVRLRDPLQVVIPTRLAQRGSGERRPSA